MTATTTTLERRTRQRGSSDEITAYLARLGVSVEPPSIDALKRLHRAHVERVPYETFWIHLGERWGIGAAQSMRRIATSTRGGYCFQLNGSFARLLDALGYNVSRHVAGVHDGFDASNATLAKHMVLFVDDLPDAGGIIGRWYVDVGLGDVLLEPLPLAPGASTQGPTRFTMKQTSTGGVGDWHLGHETAGVSAGVSIVDDAVDISVFAQSHVFNATSEQSRFACTVTCQRRHVNGSDVMRGRVLTQRFGDVTQTQTLGTCVDWLDALGHVFGLDLSAVDRLAIDALWNRVCQAHESWTATATAKGVLL